MPATPHWPPKSLPRLFVRTPLGEGARVELDGSQANYLGNVLRLKEGAELLAFDGSSGEWLARIADAGKKRMMLAVERRTREAETVPDVWLAFAPVKRAQTDWLVEKATELGAARLIPVVTQRTIVERVKLERLEAIAIEAAEQCGILAIPEVLEPVRLANLLEGWPRERRIIYCDEGAETNNPMSALKGITEKHHALLIGPEGGFSEEEQKLLRGLDFVTAIPLGPRILRADTAAVAAFALIQATIGDWE